MPRLPMLRLLDTRRPHLVLTLLCLLLWTPGFFTLPPGDRDESRFAQATKQMIETGDYVRIMNGTEARNRKPIGIYWLQAPFVALAQASGVAAANPIWPYRIPSALGGLLAVLATFRLGETLLNRRAALLGAAFLAVSVVLAGEVHIAKTDAALVGAVTVTMAVLGRAYAAPAQIGAGGAALFWLAMAGSILLKGPIGPMVAGLAAVTLGVVEGRFRWLLALRPGWGLPLLLAAVLPWFLAIGVATHGQFFADAVGGDLGRKLSSGDDAHWGPPGLHLLLLPVLMLASFPFLPGALVAAWRERLETAPRFLLAWVVPSWLVFEAVPTKLPHYTLPLYPALCLLAAWWLLRGDRPAVGRIWAALGIAVAALLGAALLAGPIYLGAPAWLGVPAALSCLWVAACFAPLLRRAERAHGREVHAGFMAMAAMAALYWSALQLELPHLRPLWIAPQVAALSPARPLGAVGFAEPSLMFLEGTDTRWLSPAAGAEALADGTVQSLLVDRRNLAAVEAALAGRHAAASDVAAVSGFNYSRGRQTELELLTLQRSP